MGIPKFARFLINRYPLILKPIKTETDVPPINNLYLDINGVIHKCAHNNSLIMMCSGRTYDQIFNDVFNYIDEMVHLIKPTDVLVISADGVAPRAKMNQQRTRRFRKENINPKELEAMRRQGLNPDMMFNSDSISAGTELMHELSEAFDKYIAQKIANDPIWKNLKVLLTGSDVPGEGEHKIVEYIRNYKDSNEYKEDTKHCIYGLDADLIMLGLITHEPNVIILREEVFGAKRGITDPNMRSTLKVAEKFELFYISILREYLELEFLEMKSKLKFEFNIERIIDDFIFFCFFIGNDFLPNLNTMDIEHGALSNIFLYYKDILPTLDDYITHHGKINFFRAEKIFAKLATHELNQLKHKLDKLSKESTNRDQKRRKAYEDKKNIRRRMKINVKKESFLIDLKGNDEAKIVKFKQDKINKKITDFRAQYDKEKQQRGEAVFRFEEDINDYMKDQLQRNIMAINNRDNPDYYSSYPEYDSSSNNESSSKNSDSNGNNKKKKDRPFVVDIKDDKRNKGLVDIFADDDDEPKEKLHEIKVQDKLKMIVEKASKYHNYIKDKNYCSDINIDDISDGDIGEVSDPNVSFDEEGDSKFTKEYAQRQDMDLVFQEKLISYYVKDVNEAKAFYYKEKVGIDLQTEDGRKEHKNMFSKYLEGLQWVLYYYYRGVRSWRWFYPYHYAPMISDFEKIKEYLDYDLDKVFKPAGPYSPFQSLLFILPRKSRNLIPRCYWSVYDEFPEFYPEKFGIDFNGKKMEWETIVLIPFMPEKPILEFEERMRKESLAGTEGGKFHFKR